MDEDATCLLPTPGFLLDGEPGDVEGRARDLYGGMEAAAPRVGIKSVGETYFGETQVPLSRVEQERDCPAPRGKGSVLSLPVRDAATTPQSKATQSREVTPRAKRAFSARLEGMVGGLVARLRAASAHAPRLKVILVAVGALGFLLLAPWWLQKERAPQNVSRQLNDSPSALTSEELEQTRVIEAPQVERGTFDDPEFGNSRTVARLQVWSLDEDEKKRAAQAAEAFLGGDCGGALEAYQRLVNQEGAQGVRWEPFLLQVRRHCVKKESK